MDISIYKNIDEYCLHLNINYLEVFNLLKCKKTERMEN